MLHPRFLVYVAAPFSPTEVQKTIDPERAEYWVLHNKQSASALGLEVAKLGAMPIVPHTATGGRSELESVQDYHFWIEGTAELLFFCGAILMAKNWVDSKGAVSEHGKAAAWCIPIFYTLEALAEYLQGDNIEAEAAIALGMRLAERAVDTERPEASTQLELPDIPKPPRAPTIPAPYIDERGDL